MSKHLSVMGEVVMEGFLDTGSTPVRSTKEDFVVINDYGVFFLRTERVMHMRSMCCERGNGHAGLHANAHSLFHNACVEDACI